MHHEWHRKSSGFLCSELNSILIMLCKPYQTTWTLWKHIYIKDWRSLCDIAFPFMGLVSTSKDFSTSAYMRDLFSAIKLSSLLKTAFEQERHEPIWQIFLLLFFPQSTINSDKRASEKRVRLGKHCRVEISLLFLLHVCITL